MFLIAVLINHLKYELIMETNKNNSNEVKQFAIGTKIEHNGKLYEVVESINCGDCSLKNICSNNDVDKPNSDACILRDKRISIFGECSSIARKDNKSVVFIEITKDDSNELSHTVIPLFTDDSYIQLRPVEFDIPKGFSIDKENSDLDKGIIKFKANWLTLEQLYKLAKDNVYFTNRDAIKDFCNSKIVVLANLMDIARYFNGDWNYDVTKEDIGYMIVYDNSIKAPNYTIRKINTCANVYYGNIIFKNEADAQYVIDNPNFRNILDTIFKV